ncbi:MAG: sugar ABC transporter permease [Fimbriimonadaceae bacterium]|nr:sugar ABC transporter permease [Fimbriimonadaceae bacterium]
MSKRSDLVAAIGFLAPNLLGFGLFTAGPVLFSFAASLTNWNLQRTSPLRFVGLDNYRNALASDPFWFYLGNTVYLMLGLPLAIAASLWFAVLLNRPLRFSGGWRALLYLPSFTSGVAVMVLWKALLNPDFGAINVALRSVAAGLGVTQFESPRWLLSTKNLLALSLERLGHDPGQWGLGARDALILMGLWAAIGGGNMLLYLAALTNVPTELTEAAQLDGASSWRCFRSVTWPFLAPTTFFIVVMSVIGGLQGGFEQARVMTTGGPASTTTTLSYHIYTEAFERFRIGYASAVSWILFAVVFGATLLNWKFGDRGTDDA